MSVEVILEQARPRLSDGSRSMDVVANAWGKLEPLRALVSADGTVRVLDPVAGHYTLVHRLSQAAQDSLREIAADRPTQWIHRR